MTLKQKLEAAVASGHDSKEVRTLVRLNYASVFNNDPPYKEEVDQGVKCFDAGVSAERHRLRPILEAMIKECVSALEYYGETDNWPYATKGKCPGEKANAALAALERLVGEKDG